MADKYVVGKLNGYGDIDLYLEITPRKYHNWVASVNFATRLTYKSAIKIAAQMNRESTYSAYTVKAVK